MTIFLLLNLTAQDTISTTDFLSLVPTQYIETLKPEEQFSAEQMDGKIFTYTEKLAKYKIAYYLGELLTNPINIPVIISVRPMTLSRIKFVIGLNLFLNWYYGMVITEKGINILMTPQIPFVSQTAEL